MKLNELHPNVGSRSKRMRKGRGRSSGNGKTSGRGQKGQKSRSGGGTYLAFEGGQMPLYRRLPKRGFNHTRFDEDWVVINVSQLNDFTDGETVDIGALRQTLHLSIPAGCHNLKVLGNGELEKKLTVKATAFSETARKKIEEAGGKTEEV